MQEFCVFPCQRETHLVPDPDTAGQELSIFWQGDEKWTGNEIEDDQY